MATVYQQLERFDNGKLLGLFHNALKDFDDSVKARIFPPMNKSVTENDGFFAVLFHDGFVADKLVSAFKQMSPTSRSFKPVTAGNVSYYQAVSAMLGCITENYKQFDAFLSQSMSRMQKTLFNLKVNEKYLRRKKSEIDNHLQAFHEHEKQQEVIFMLEHPEHIAKKNKYIASCDWYLGHLYQEIENEMLANKSQALQTLFTLIDASNDILLIEAKKEFYHYRKVSPVLLNAMMSLTQEVTFKQAVASKNSSLMIALKKAQMVLEAKNVLLGTDIKGASLKDVPLSNRVANFESRVKRLNEQLTYHRRKNSYFDTFLRGLGVFGAALAGTVLCGVGAFYMGYKAYKDLFVKTTGHDFVKEVDATSHLFRRPR